MNKLTAPIRAALLESSGWKTFFSAIIPIIVGVLSGVFVAEITTAKGLQWPLFYKSWSFYGIIFIILVVYFYYRAIYFHEKSIEKFLDDDYCRAYMRSKCLPEAAERYRELIRNGERGELSAAMKEFERILK